MLDLIKKLFDLNLPFAAILSVIQKLIAVGMPPDIKEEAGLRTWVLSLVDAVKGATEITKTTFDDKILKFVEDTVNSQSAWDLFYRILKVMFVREANAEYSSDDEVRRLACELCEDMGCDCEDGCCSAEGEIVNISPVIVIQIISAIIQIIKMFRR